MAITTEKTPTTMAEKPVANTPQVDEALKFLRQEGESFEFSAEEEKRLVSKIDWMIMPLMVRIRL